MRINIKRIPIIKIARNACFRNQKSTYILNLKIFYMGKQETGASHRVKILTEKLNHFISSFYSQISISFPCEFYPFTHKLAYQFPVNKFVKNYLIKMWQIFDKKNVQFMRINIWLITVN